MAATYEIDATRGLVRTTLAGRVTDDDLAEHQRRLAADPAFSAQMHQLVETAAVAEIAVTGEGIRRVAQANLFGPASRRATVAAQDSHYGMARMFQLLRDAGPEEIAVFRTPHEAHAWLGLAERPEA